MALLPTLIVLTNEEKENLRLYLQSPFFMVSVRNHKSDSLLALYDFLINNLKPEQEDFDKETIYAQLFPNKKYAEATINALASELHRLLKDFAKWQTRQNAHNENEQLLLARFYRQRGLEKLFLKTIGNLREEITKMNEQNRDIEIFLLQYLADLELCLFESTKNNKSDDLHLSETISSLDQFYAFGRLEYTANLLHQSLMVSFENAEMLPTLELVKMMGDAPNLTVPTIRAFHQIIQILLANNDAEKTQQFADFQHFMRENEEKIPPEKLKLLLAYERSICARLYQSGNDDLLPDLFDLYKRQLQAGHLYQSGGLLPSVFQNIVATGLRLGETDWVTDFLEQHPPARLVFCQSPEEVHQFMLACLHFQKRDFPRTMQYLALRYEDNYYALHANLLELKLYYERRNLNLLLNKLNSFKVNIFKKSKQWLPAARHDSISRFIDIVRQLLHDKIQMEHDKAAVERLRQKILETRNIAEREWLLEKLAEISLPL